jgi:glycosyltransferase involved in cell wall biosynthesis
MQASIIVPSYNSLSTIERCLNALQQQRTDFSYEVIVVDSSDDGTGEFIESRFPAVKLIRLCRRTLPGLARNLGIEKAAGKVLVFTDSDCVPEPSWLDKMIREQEKGEYSVIGGSVLNGLPLNPVAWSGYLLEFSESLPSSPRRFVQLIPTCNVSIQRSVFDRHGLFPTDVWPMEDGIFCMRLSRAGEKLLFEPSIRVRHIFRPHLGAFLRHQIRLGKASAEARRRKQIAQAWLADHPLRWLGPGIRLFRLETRLLRQSIPTFLGFNLLLPLCFGGLVAWGIGFCAPTNSES